MPSRSDATSSKTRSCTSRIGYGGGIGAGNVRAHVAHLTIELGVPTPRPGVGWTAAPDVQGQDVRQQGSVVARRCDALQPGLRPRGPSPGSTLTIARLLRIAAWLIGVHGSQRRTTSSISRRRRSRPPGFVGSWRTYRSSSPRAAALRRGRVRVPGGVGPDGVAFGGGGRTWHRQRHGAHNGSTRPTFL